MTYYFSRLTYSNQDSHQAFDLLRHIQPLTEWNCWVSCSVHFQSVVKQGKIVSFFFFNNVSASSSGRILSSQDECALDTGWNIFKLFTLPQNNWTTLWFQLISLFTLRHSNLLTINTFQNFICQNCIDKNCFVIMN